MHWPRVYHRRGAAVADALVTQLNSGERDYIARAMGMARGTPDGYNSSSVLTRVPPSAGSLFAGP